MPGYKLNYLINDIPTNVDSLGFKPYVEAIVEFLTSEYTFPPITLSIEGQWGSGKTSFMRQLNEEIQQKNVRKGNGKYFTVWFNCWKYEKEDELWASFALNLIDQLSAQFTWKRRQYSKFKLLLLRYKLRLKSNLLIIIHFSWIILFSIAVISLFSLATIYVLNYLNLPLPYFIDSEFIKQLTNIVLYLTPIVSFIKLLSIQNWLIDLFRDPFGLKKLESHTNYKERISFRERFFSDFQEIIHSYVGKDSKVYVFIDDLDRCEVPKAAELMQALIFMISPDSNVNFSLCFDRKIIAAGLASKNKEVINYLGVDGLEYGYEFIEKFIQLPFKIPAPRIRGLSNSIIQNNESELFSRPTEPMDEMNTFNDSSYNNSKKDNKSYQDENEETEKNENSSQNTTTDSKKSNVLNDLDCDEGNKYLEIILEMVAPALYNNPRRIKQFINLFRFQRFIGYKTGLFYYRDGTDPKYMWNCIKLAKFLAIRIKWPSLISALSSNVTLIEQLQLYALMREEDLKTERVNKSEEYIELEKWLKDYNLLTLLRYGCMGEGNLSVDIDKYTLSGLDFSKLFEISPEVTSSYSLFEIIKNMEFIRIPVGEFEMGSPNDEVGRAVDEGPVHEVSIKNSYYLGKYPITQKQWIAVMGYNPSQFKGEGRPVENVSWNDVQEFIKELNELIGTERYRLPSEAEWEYACRAGTKTRFSFGDDDKELGNFAWFNDNSGDETHPVGKLKPNPWGLYDMYGNVWEWCQDRWHDNYNGAPSDGSAWESGSSSSRVSRGGCWNHNTRGCRSASRDRNVIVYRSLNLGFRLVRDI